MSLKRIRTLLLTGVGVVVPLAVSLWVLLAVVDFLASLLDPVRAVLQGAGIQSRVTIVLIQVASVVALVVLLLLVGFVAQRQFGKQVVSSVDAYLAKVPGIGSVYQTARRMSDLVLSPDESGGGSQFREVKLVEFPGRDTYTLGFLTTNTPPDGVVRTARTITGVSDQEYRTLFLPMAPNPIMGGHLTHVPADRVHDVDLEIEDAIQYILTMGVVDDPDQSDEPDAIEQR